MWLALNREGIRVARCTVEPLMRELGLHGARRGHPSSPVTGRWIQLKSGRNPVHPDHVRYVERTAVASTGSPSRTPPVRAQRSRRGD